MVSQWGCWNTYYVAPTADTLGHEFMLSGNRGAAAVLGASTLTEAPAEAEMGKALFNYLPQQGMTLGEAILRAKRDVAERNPISWMSFSATSCWVTPCWWWEGSNSHLLIQLQGPGAMPGLSIGGLLSVVRRQFVDIDQRFAKAME